MAKAVFPGMRDRKWGRIVNIGSINGQAGQYGQVNYAAAKSGIHGFTKALAQEGARAGVTVNAIAPGYIDTDMVAAVPADVLEKIVAKIPVGRLGQAQRDRARRGVPVLRGWRVRHRIDAVDQRRAAYVLTGAGGGYARRRCAKRSARHGRRVGASRTRPTAALPSSGLRDARKMPLANGAPFNFAQDEREFDLIRIDAALYLQQPRDLAEIARDGIHADRAQSIGMVGRAMLPGDQPDDIRARRDRAGRADRRILDDRARLDRTPSAAAAWR